MNMMTPVHADLNARYPLDIPLLFLFPAKRGQVLRLVCHGLSNKEVAHEMGISEAAVKMHVREAFALLGATSRIQFTLIMMGTLAPNKPAAVEKRLAEVVNEHNYEFYLTFGPEAASTAKEDDDRKRGDAGSRMRRLWEQMRALRMSLTAPVVHLNQRREIL